LFAGERHISIVLDTKVAICDTLSSNTIRHEEKMMQGKKPSESAERLADMIKKAIADCEITSAEYNAVMKIANEDQHIDPQEQNLLNQLQSLIANGTVKRVKG
jgi:hypothetical protein